MQRTIKDILAKHNIINPLLLTELTGLYSECIGASKEFGKRISQLRPEEERAIWKKLMELSWKGEEEEIDKLKDSFRICKK